MCAMRWNFFTYIGKYRGSASAHPACGVQGSLESRTSAKSATVMRRLSSPTVRNLHITAASCCTARNSGYGKESWEQDMQLAEKNSPPKITMKCIATGESSPTICGKNIFSQ